MDWNRECEMTVRGRFSTKKLSKGKKIDYGEIVEQGCSKCGYPNIIWASSYQYEYCPHCGAKVLGGGNRWSG